MSTTEDTPADESTDLDSVNAEELANQATTGHENGTISRATVYHAHSGEEGLYFELENSLGAKSTRKLTTLITGFAAALFDELEEPRSVTIVGHMNGDEPAMATAELEGSDFEALDESHSAFRKRVVENLERVI